MPDRPGFVAWSLERAVRAYQLLVRPALPPVCRFVPSCSAYAREALTAHGALRGGWLAIRRVGRCTAWHPGGFDPVPARRES